MIANRYFALLDILGFSKMVKHRPLGDLVADVQRVLRLSDARDAQISWVPRAGQGARREDSLSIGRYHFSDTLFLWSDPVSESDPELELRISQHFYSFLCDLVSFALFQGIPLRGAISFGATFVDANTGIVVGQPVIDAYRLEQAQEWIGVALHPTCSNRSQHKEASFFIVRYSPPLKPTASDTPSVTLDWTTPLRVTAVHFARIHGFDPRVRFDAVMAAGRMEDPAIRQKYENTAAFVAAMQQTRQIYDSFAMFTGRR